MVVITIIFAITQALLTRTIDNWWRVNANADAQQQLYKAQTVLERDLAAAAYERENGRETFTIHKLPPELESLDGAGADGDAFWFLSAIDPVTGRFMRTEDGEPFWQRNVLYYLVTPSAVETLGFEGTGLDLHGYESACPYKILIRKEIDFGTPTDPTDQATSEPLMTYFQIAPLLTRPVGYDLSGMSGPNVSVQPVAANILSFRVDPVNSIGGFEVDLRATAIDRAKREGRIGSRDLANDPATQQLRLTLFPPNRQGSGSTEP
jgi:hypothetical protein